MKIQIKNKIYFKSDIKDFVLPNKENLALNIINKIKSRENEVIITDEDSNRITSYEMVDRVEKVAKGFELLNYLNKNDIVGFISGNIIEYTYCVLGAVLDGLVVSPINPNSTFDEIKNTLSSLNPKCIVVDFTNYNRLKDHFNQLFPSCKSIIVFGEHYNQSTSTLESQINYNNNSIKIIDFNQFINNNGNYNTSKSVLMDDQDLVFILFSSGTTGLFKGVSLSHINILSNIRQIILGEYSHFKTKQVILSSLPLYHSFGLTVVFLSIFSFGGGFILMKKYSTTKFLQIVQNERVSYAFIVPPIGVDLSKSPLVKDYDCSSLTTIFSGGAPFPEDIVESLKRNLNSYVDKSCSRNDILLDSKLVVRQGYGLSETSPVISISNINNFKYGSSGLLVPNLIAKITHLENGDNLDSNEIGELCVKGPNVMKCYYNNENTTKNTFDNEGFLLTGDIGYFDDEGYLYLVDRKKDMIKCYGYQVAPAELESILLNHPKIKDVCIIGVPAEKGGEFPKAYIVLKPNETLLEIEVHEWLKPKVSHYKYLRGGICFTDIIPKSPSGKILRRLLRDSNSKKQHKL